MTRQRTDGRYEASRQMRTFAGPRRFSGYGGTPAEAEADLEAKHIRAGLLQHSASLDRSVQAAQSEVCLRDELLQFAVEIQEQISRERLRNEGPISAGLPNVAPGAIRHIIACVDHGVRVRP